jgi:hypothetical protein
MTHLQRLAVRSLAGRIAEKRSGIDAVIRPDFATRRKKFFTRRLAEFHDFSHGKMPWRATTAHHQRGWKNGIG